MTSSEFPRHGHTWDAHDYRRIVEGCLAGVPEHQIAVHVGRKAGAVRSRASYLIDDDPHGSRGAWVRLRKELAANPSHDWEAVVRRRHAAEGLPYWDEDADALLEQVWAAAVPARSWLRRAKRATSQRMPDLEATLGIHEFDIALRLCYRGRAASLAEVVDRLGASADGVLAARARLQADRATVTLHVLTVSDDSGAVLHTSLHPTRTAAVAFKDDALAGQYAVHPLAMWTITTSSLGEPARVGEQPVSGTFTPAVAGREPVDLDELPDAG